MRPGVEEAYQELADHVVDTVDDAWAVAWLVAEIETDEGGTTFGRYKNSLALDRPVHSIPTDASVYEAFDRIRSILRREGEEPFTRAVFTLRSDGRFSMDFEYGALEGSQLDRARDLIARKAAELHE